MKIQLTNRCCSFFFFFFFFNSCLLINASYVTINSLDGSINPVDPRTYFLDTTIHENVGLWVEFSNNFDPEDDQFWCSPEIDATYLPYFGYMLDRWYFKIYDYGVSGGIAVSISVLDLHEFVYRAWTAGVWQKNPLNCNMIWQNIQSLFVEPLLESVSIDQTYPTLRVDGYGLSLEILCKSPGYQVADYDTNELTDLNYVPCDSTTLLNIISMNPNSPFKRI